jgi:hypothetical protein
MHRKRTLGYEVITALVSPRTEASSGWQIKDFRPIKVGSWVRI